MVNVIFTIRMATARLGKRPVYGKNFGHHGKGGKEMNENIEDYRLTPKGYLSYCLSKHAK
jgi:hypothetical protein